MNNSNHNSSNKPAINIRQPPVVVNGITAIDVSPPHTVIPFCAAEDTVVKLRAEQQVLQSQLRHLQHHLSLRKLHAGYAGGVGKKNRRMDSSYGNSRLLNERRKALVASHSTSVRGPHAQEYRTLLTEHVRLEDQLRQVTAARIVARYRLQKLVIDTARPPNGAIPPMAILENALPVRVPCFPEYPAKVVASMDPTAQIVDNLHISTGVGTAKRPGDVPHPEPPPKVVVSSHKGFLQVRDRPTGDALATPSHISDFTPHTLEALPPPGLSYSPNELNPDRPTLTYETSYVRTRLEEDGQGPTTLLVAANRFFPEKGEHRVCAVCGNVMKVQLDDFQVLADHLQQVHHRLLAQSA